MGLTEALQEEIKLVAAAAKAEEQRIETIRQLAVAVREGSLSIDDLSPARQVAVREQLAREGYGAGNAGTIKGIVMRGQRAQQEVKATTRKELIAAGCEMYYPEQDVFTAVIRKQLDGCESGEYPTATKIAQAVVGDKSTKLLAKPGKARLRRAFAENKEHPAMQLIHSVANNSAMVAAASGSVSNCLGALTNNHKVARVIAQERAERLQEQKQQRERTDALEAELAIVRAEAAQAKADAARANTRLDEADQWKTDAVELYLAGKSYAEIADKVGKGKSTVNDYIRSLISAGKLAKRPA